MAVQKGTQEQGKEFKTQSGRQQRRQHLTRTPLHACTPTCVEDWQVLVQDELQPPGPPTQQPRHALHLLCIAVVRRRQPAAHRQGQGRNSFS